MLYANGTSAIVIAFVLFLLMLTVHWAGLRVRLLRRRQRPDETINGGSIEGSLLGLLALLLAFTFSMANERYDTRRAVIIQEANAIGTAVLRADLYPDTTRQQFRADFKQYVEARISYYTAGVDSDRIQAAVRQSDQYSAVIWARATRLSRQTNNLLPANLMIPALNDMIDVVTTRDAALIAQIPASIMYVLISLCLVGSFIIGYMAEKSDWMLTICFAFMTALSIYLILDLDRPRQGLITTDAMHQKMVDLRAMFPEK
ncbi:bestrophin-like domain [Spirosoma validum]|uniref:DUF4239 domain-containing protein n=1 Tax=Spirosoma validum TaxID=2771355 RepID=A0A927GBI0_9BACT|nr:hypothetical protein [Spirosoma validum]MBD2751421.1 hypothetical protein [Spirosoma validum]